MQQKRSSGAPSRIDYPGIAKLASSVSRVIMLVKIRKRMIGNALTPSRLCALFRSSW
jgi:hypothetical protein